MKTDITTKILLVAILIALTSNHYKAAPPSARASEMPATGPVNIAVDGDHQILFAMDPWTSKIVLYRYETNGAVTALVAPKKTPQ